MRNLRGPAPLRFSRPVNTATGSDQSPTLHGFVTSPSSSTASAFGQSTDCLTKEQVDSLREYEDFYRDAYGFAKLTRQLASQNLL